MPPERQHLVFSDAEVLADVAKSGARFTLTDADVALLKEAGARASARNASLQFALGARVAWQARAVRAQEHLLRPDRQHARHPIENRG